MTTGCCIAGGGPAGMMLGLMLARAGVEVTVLEKHADFLRDFRGDTIHPSTLEVLDELGLAGRFERLEHYKIDCLRVVTDTGEMVFADLRRLRGRYPYVAMVPQWDFLSMVAEAASELPSFRLLMEAEAYSLTRDAAGRVTGLRYRDAKGEDRRIRADLTVAADGRHSALRRAADLRPRDFGAPMDVAWFRLPRTDSDPADSFLRLGAPYMLVMINRRTYWQLGYIVPKGAFDRVRQGGVEELRDTLDDLVPFLASRTGELDLDQIGVLKVQVDRLRRWYLPGFLCIGDAAHAMSPVGGIGINLAIQDAVAAANRLTGPLLRGRVHESDLAAVQRRRLAPTAAVQLGQLAIQNAIIRPTLQGGPPRAAMLMARLAGLPPLPHLIARMAAHGPRPEHLRPALRSL